MGDHDYRIHHFTTLGGSTSLGNPFLNVSIINSDMLAIHAELVPSTS